MPKYIFKTHITKFTHFFKSVSKSVRFSNEKTFKLVGERDYESFDNCLIRVVKMTIDQDPMTLIGVGKSMNLCYEKAERL